MVVGADDDELELVPPDLAATATSQGLVCVEGRVPAADEDDPLTDVHATASTAIERLDRRADAAGPERRTRSAPPRVNPRCACSRASGPDLVDLVEVRDPDGEVALVTRQGEERGLGEARIRAAVGQSDVAAADLQGRDRRRCRRRGSGRRGVRGRGRSRCCAAGSRRGRRRLRRRCSDSRTEPAARGEEHDDVGGADRVQVGGRADCDGRRPERLQRNESSRRSLRATRRSVVGVAVAGDHLGHGRADAAGGSDDGDPAGAREGSEAARGPGRGRWPR